LDPISVGTAITTGLTFIAKFLNTAKDYSSYYKNTSLPEATKLTRVEPITIVSKDLLNNPVTRVVLNSQLSIFAGYYLQAIDILTKVGDVEVVRILDRLNPDRDETGFLLSSGRTSGRTHGFESFRLISQEGYNYRLPTHSRPAMEAIVNDREANAARKDIFDQVTKLESDKLRLQEELEKLDKSKKEYAERKKDLEDKIRKADDKSLELKEIGSSQEIDLDTLVNLSVGRLINIKIVYTKDDTKEQRGVTVPISIRLLVSSIPNESIARIMTYQDRDNSLVERIHDARSGRIEFIRDLILCQDLIDEYKKAVIQDPTNVLSEITRRASNSKKYGLLTKNPSLVAASSLFVISDAVARDIEGKLGGKLSNPRIREKAFENTYAMIITVVSEEWETVTFYTRGIARAATFGFKELEGKTKGTGPDIGDIMKALTAGQPPSF